MAVSLFWVLIVSPLASPKLSKLETGPPEKNGVRADSIIARPGTSRGPSAGRQNHLEVVTFDPAQAYPEFIVNFVEK